MTRHFALGLLLLATPAAAQRLEVTPLVAYTTAADIDKKATGVETLEVSDGFAWGAQVGYFLSEHVGFEALWMRQATNVSMSTSSGNARLFDMKVDQVLGNLVYQFGGASASLRPFVFGGLGPAFLSADDFDTETKLAWTVGGGVKWFPSSRIGGRAHLRYKPTRLNASDAETCGPFGFCQGSLQQFEVAGGLIVRF